MDDAFVRRIEFFIYVGLPTKSEIILLMQNTLEAFTNTITEKEYQKIAKKIEGAAHSFIKALIIKSYYNAKEELMPKIFENNDFQMIKKHLQLYMIILRLF